MTSLFDSKVNDRRNETPWAVMSLQAFMKDMAINSQEPVTFSCQYRPDVASRFWYTVTWTDASGQKRGTESQDPDLCLWRAAEMELRARKRLEKVDIDLPPMEEAPEQK